MSGLVFGRLTVGNKYEIRQVGKKTYSFWECFCECGTTKFFRSDQIKSKKEKTKSCGCINKEGKSGRFMHGETKTNLHNRWNGIKARCLNKNNSNYHKYGAKGIKICDEWIKDYTSFRDWALTNGFSENLTIDRIDVYGNYEPTNCRWITQKEQQGNTTRNIRLTHNNRTEIAQKWDEIYGVSKGTTAKMLRNGKSVEDIFKLRENKVAQ